MAMTQTRLNAEFTALKRGDAMDLTDVALRIGIAFVCSLALWFATSLIITLVWGISYSVLTLAHVIFLRSRTGDVQKWELLAAIASSVVPTLYFSAMIIFVAMIADGELVLLASSGCIGVALHCLARNTEFSISAYIDALCVVVAGVGRTLAEVHNVSDTSKSVAVAVGALCALIYFWFSFRQIIEMRIALEEKTLKEIQSQKMRAWGQLTSGVAHDFNNLLTVIRGNVELASIDPNDKQNKEYLQAAEIASDRGAELVRQLLAYGRQSELRTTQLDLSRMLERLCVVLPRILPATIELEYQEAEFDLVFETDETLLESALLNLVINARNAIGSAKGRIRIGAEKNPNGTCLDITVEDSGPGMSEEVLARASDPFFTTRGVGEGSGLGLSMVAGFAKQSGGDLLFEDLAPRGFRATLRLPL